MRSLRANLLFGTSVGMVIVLLVVGLLLNMLVRRSLVEQFDRALLDEARMLASTIEFEEGGVVLDFAELELITYRESSRPGHLEVWLQEERVIYRSPSLGLADLERPCGPHVSKGFLWVNLRDGRTGRSVGLTFLPREEVEEGDEADGMEEDEDEEEQIPLVTLVLARHTEPIDQAISRLMGRLVLGGLFTILVSITVLSLVIHRSLLPLTRLAGRIGMLDERNLSTGLEGEAGPREVRPIIDQLNRLLNCVTEAFQRERLFIADMGHELRTPLSGLRSIIDVVLARPRPAESYREGLEDCREITLEMQDMVSRLLYQGRLESGQVDIQPEPLEVNRLLRTAWASLADRAGQRGLSVVWALDNDDTLITDLSLFSLVVQNIVGNAVEHADEGGRVRIATAFNGVPLIRISNSGSELSPDAAGHVFERFWRGDKSRSSGRGHSGLGLTLVRRAVTMMGGEVKVDTEVGGEFVISITIPSADAEAQNSIA